jgi:hypothetical protein
MPPSTTLPPGPKGTWLRGALVRDGANRRRPLAFQWVAKSRQYQTESSESCKLQPNDGGNLGNW